MSALATEPFGPVQRIAAGVLDVGYVDVGPSGGQAVLLLHGWPYDIHSYADVAPALAAAGYRVIDRASVSPESRRRCIGGVGGLRHLRR